MNVWILCYDIREPKRLQRVHRFMCKCAQPVQYSVFLLIADDEGVARLLRHLEAYIEDEDDVRVYGIQAACHIETLGQAILPEGLLLLE
ncbi:hypothetical protein WH50_24985 [Pokkaliibacter plantistimulans]|uniref:CRISPR-associated endoribonuclease Cas2 n=1 Tax=Pokkaliibacter plantistimulans TaxID=1635171 RepID=A0ABX5LT38_9GAMM|nr:CRISPR-associated endonuclease Cas2 [Pokkaliibacter plantistimulans]PXF28688.1 hypothetical protein WH50_24985 [Pokkaliibacter plantistimulans]